MFVTTILLLVWGLLMYRSCVAEFNYYQSVKTHEPKIWQQLGSPAWFVSPFVFVSPKGAKKLSTATDETVKLSALKYRQAGMQFLGYFALVLVTSIIYFKMA